MTQPLEPTNADREAASQYASIYPDPHIREVAMIAYYKGRESGREHERERAVKGLEEEAATWLKLQITDMDHDDVTVKIYILSEGSYADTLEGAAAAIRYADTLEGAAAAIRSGEPAP